MNVSQALSLGLVGVVINGQDIGGFEASNEGERWANPELLIRWTAAGAFLPWFRNHYVRKGRKEFQEPFMYV
jgi:alpha-glucosidase